MRLSRAVIAAALLVGTAACASASVPSGQPPVSPSAAATTSSDSRSGVALTGTPSSTECGWGDGPGKDVPTYRGMTLTAAKERAASEDLEVRDVGADGECFIVTADYKTDRVNFYSRRGVVIWAQLG